jgi:hypothetical protein
MQAHDGTATTAIVTSMTLKTSINGGRCTSMAMNSLQN